MRTNYNDSSSRNNTRYPKRQNSGGGGGGRRQTGSGRRNPSQQSGGGATNIAGMSSTRNKYLEMAKEALSNGNRVEAENYYQHAEHYSKMLNAAVASRRERSETQDSSLRRHSGSMGSNAGGHGEAAAINPADGADAQGDTQKPETI